jgi:hypothetical protein
MARDSIIRHFMSAFCTAANWRFVPQLKPPSNTHKPPYTEIPQPHPEPQFVISQPRCGTTSGQGGVGIVNGRAKCVCSSLKTILTEMPALCPNLPTQIPIVGLITISHNSAIMAMKAGTPHANHMRYNRPYRAVSGTPALAEAIASSLILAWMTITGSQKIPMNT